MTVKKMKIQILIKIAKILKIHFLIKKYRIVNLFATKLKTNLILEIRYRIHNKMQRKKKEKEKKN
jgi:hypothetical protein